MSFSLLPFPINAKTYKVQAGYTAKKSQKENESKTTTTKGLAGTSKLLELVVMTFHGLLFQLLRTRIENHTNKPTLIHKLQR